MTGVPTKVFLGSLRFIAHKFAQVSGTKGGIFDVSGAVHLCAREKRRESIGAAALISVSTPMPKARTRQAVRMEAVHESVFD